MGETKSHNNETIYGVQIKQASFFNPLSHLSKSGSLIFIVDIVILDCNVDAEMTILLGRPFLAIERAWVDV